MRSTRLVPVLVLALAGLGLHAARERRAAAAPSSVAAQHAPAAPDAAHTGATRGADAPSPAAAPGAARAAQATRPLPDLTPLAASRGSNHDPAPLDPQDYGLRVLDVLVERAP